MKLIKAAFVFAALVMTGAQAHALPDLSGKYAMKGQGDLPNDPPYGGVCNLKLVSPVYEVMCLNDNGDRYQGKGILEGDTFSLYLGEYLVVYKVAKDGSLIGRWAHAHSKGTGKESLTPTN